MLALLLLQGCGSERSQADPKGFIGYFPEDLSLTMLLDSDDIPSAFRSAGMKIDDVGRPILHANTMFLPVRTDPNQKAVPPFRISDVDSIDHCAWMSDGSMLIISGKQLGGITQDGFRPMVQLPFTGMKIVAAGPSLCYLYSGDTEEHQRNLHLLQSDGTLIHLLKAPAPITAVAGLGQVTVVAIGKHLFALTTEGSMEPIYIAEADVTSLALTASTGVFYGTDQSAGYVYRPGHGYAFCTGNRATVAVHENALLLYLANDGIYHCAPVSAFRSLAVGIHGAGVQADK